MPMLMMPPPGSPLLEGADVEQKRAEILAYFHATFDRYELLFELLSGEEAYFKKPIALRHPLIFLLWPYRDFFLSTSCCLPG